MESNGEVGELMKEKLKEVRQRFRRSGSVGMPFVKQSDAAKIKQELAEKMGVGDRPVLTIVVTSYRKLDILAEVLTSIKNPVRIRHIESRTPQCGSDQFELFMQMELDHSLKPETIVDDMRSVRALLCMWNIDDSTHGLDVQEIACEIPPATQDEKHVKENQLFFDSGVDEAIKEAPWFPRTAADLDVSSNRVLMYGSELDADHPGFKDKVYRERRMMFAELAKNYKHGEKIPRVEYNAAEKATWRTVYHELTHLHRKHACQVYLDNFRLLEKYAGYGPDNVPQLQDVSEFLKARTGFRVRPVAGYLSSRDFLAGLAFRVFYCTQYIRHGDDPFYSPEPDCVHELMGHIPLFADPDFAQFSQDLGVASLGSSDDDLNKLATLYFFSIEFGVTRVKGGDFKVFGAGLLSSASELKHAVEDGGATLIRFDPDRVIAQECMITCYQTAYFYTDDFEEAQQKLRTFVNHMRREFHLRYNAYTESVEVLNNRRSLTIAVNALRSDVNVLAAALHHVL